MVSESDQVGSSAGEPAARPDRLELLVAVAAVGVGTAVAGWLGARPPAWPAAVAGWCVAWGVPLAVLARRGAGPLGPALGGEWRRWELAGWCGLLVAALVVRLVLLTEIPIRLHNDEMSCGLAAQRFLDPPTLGVFATSWMDHPNLGFFLTSLVLDVLGETLFALRASSVLLGMLSLLGGGLLVRSLFGRWPAIAWLGLTAPYHWHVHLSRSGFHNIQATAATVWTLLLLVIGIRTRRPVWFAAAGVVLGIGAQTYNAARLVPFIVVAWALAWLLLRRARVREAAAALVLVLGMGMVTVAPMVPHFLRRPGTFEARTATVFVFGEQARRHVNGLVGSTRFGDVLRYQLARTASMWLSGGDTSLQYGFRGPFLDPVLWPFALLGAALGAVATWRLARRGDPGGCAVPEGLAHLLLWLWIGGTLVAGSVLTIDPPFSPRLAGMATAVMVPPALGLVAVVERFLRWGRASGVAVAIGAGGLVVAAGAGSLYDSFVDWPSYAGAERRDLVVRHLAAHPEILRVLDLTHSPEEFGFQSYRFLVPDVEGVLGDPGGDPVAQVEALGEDARPLLVLVPGPEVDGLVAAFPGAVAGRFADPRVSDPCSWVLVGGRERP